MTKKYTKEYLERKEKYLLKDLESAFSGYERLVSQVNSIRTWTVTIMIACIGFLVTTFKTLPLEAVAIPAMLTLLAFLILELRERSSMRFNKNEVLKIQKLLMQTDDDKFRKSVHKYRYRDLRLNELDRAKKIGHLIESLKNFQITYWYFFWIIVFWSLVIVLEFTQ